MHVLKEIHQVFSVWKMHVRQFVGLGVFALGCMTLVVSNLGAEEPDENKFLSATRQLTLDGKRSGEGYFSADGQQMVFQSERQADNPFIRSMCSISKRVI